MDDSSHGQSDTPDDILDEVDTNSEAKTGLSESDEENIEGAVGGAINKDGQLDQIKAQNTTQQTYDNDGDSHITSDEGKVMEGAVGGVTVSCDQCETETAIMYCQNCPGYLCKICYDTHNKSKLTRKHSYINISPRLLTASLNVQNENALSQEKVSIQISCKEHPNKLAENICKTCGYPACSDCSPIHSGHNLVDLHQKHFRQLQSVCLDDSQLLLTLISKLETLQTTASSEGLYNSAINKMTLTKQKFDNLTDIDGNYNLIVESLGKEKREVIEKHSKKLDDIRDTLEEATFALSKLQFAGTTTDINIVFEALNHFYMHYNTLVTTHANLLAKKYTKPDAVQLKNISAHMIYLENAFDCYKKPWSKYDRLKKLQNHDFIFVSDFISISHEKFIWIGDFHAIGYFDVNTKKLQRVSTLQNNAHRLAILTDSLTVAISSDAYNIFNKNMEILSTSPKKADHKAFAVWDFKYILELTWDKKIFKISLLNFNDTTRRMMFTTTDIQGVDATDVFLMACNASKEIFIIVQKSSELYKFSQNGNLLSSVTLIVNSLTHISSVHIDEDDNLVVGCTNGKVYFVDYKRKREKLLLTLWGPVMRVGDIDGLLYAFVSFYKNEIGGSESSLYVYEIDQ